jgi:hypothetical protein
MKAVVIQGDLVRNYTTLITQTPIGTIITIIIGEGEQQCKGKHPIHVIDLIKITLNLTKRDYNGPFLGSAGSTWECGICFWWLVRCFVPPR